MDDLHVAFTVCFSLISGWALGFFHARTYGAASIPIYAAIIIAIITGYQIIYGGI